MSGISYLPLLAGAGMIVAAFGILGLDWYLLGKTRGQLVAAQVCPIRGDWRGRLALLLLGWGPILLAIGFVALAGAHLGGSR